MQMNMIKNIRGFIFGLLFGSTSPIPGVSAGTLAIFLNIYEDVFNSISIAGIKRNWMVFSFFFIGGCVGLFGGSKVIALLHHNYEQVVIFSLIGLMLGCTPVIYKKATGTKIKPINVLLFIGSIALMVFLALYSGENANRTLEQLGILTPAVAVWIFVASSISSMAMLIPGVGGSLMMIVFGVYVIYLEAIKTLNFPILFIFFSSMFLGIFLGAKLIKKLLDSYSQSLYSSILGFIIGSVFFIFPGFSKNVTEGVLSILFALLFGFLAYKMSKQEV
jgi:putative membrane protein